MIKRTWCYVMKPPAYEISCDLCGGDNITWSEFEHMIWCFDCKKDTAGTSGVLDGIVALQAAPLLGLSFDRIDLETGKRLYMKELDGKLTWDSNPPD